MRLPTFEVYCTNTTGQNALRFDMESLTVWFSYRMPVAFARPRGVLVVRENIWGPTTGKHLNAIDGGSREARRARVSEEAFTTMLGLALA